MPVSTAIAGLMRVMARSSASDMARIACASATPASSFPRQIGRLTPTIAI